MKQSALRSKMEHDRRLFTTLRKVVKDLRKTKAKFFIKPINEAR